MKIKGMPTYTKDSNLIECSTKILDFSIDTLRQTGEIIPIVYLFTENKQHVYTYPFKNDNEKRSFAKFIQQECLKHSAHWFWAVLDSWMTKKTQSDGTDPQKFLNSSEYIQPSKDPDRTEALLLMIIYPDGKSDTICAAYDRDKNRNIVFNDSAYWFDTKKSFSGLFLPWVNNYH